MEIPDPPAVGMCARCGHQKMVDRPCRRCGAMANRPRPLQRVRMYAEGIAFVLVVLAFSAGAWGLVVWLSLWFWSLV